MFAGRGKYWVKLGAVVIVSFSAILLLTLLVLIPFPHGNAVLKFDEEPMSPATPVVSDRVHPPTSPPTLPAGTVNDIDFEAYSSELANIFDLRLGETRLDTIDKIRLFFSPEPGTNMVNLTSSTFELDDGAVMLFARHDLPDDSVFSQEIYAVFSGPGEASKFNQTLEAYGLRIKCRRGENAMEWTTELCP